MSKTKIVSSNKQVQPFMRGMLTHSLVQRGMEFKKAYKTAQDVKQRLSKTESITTYALKTVINEEIKKRYGKTFLEKLDQPQTDVLSVIRVLHHESSFPFSRGLLAKSLTAAGISPGRAYEMAQEIQQEMVRENIQSIDQQLLYQQVYQKLLYEEGPETAEFYEIATQLKRLDRPMIIYIGGAVGIGKSSLATELASRLDISKVNGTDMIRQIMRMVFTEQILPALHTSSFEVAHLEVVSRLKEEDQIIAGFTWQAAKVIVGVRAVVERAIQENINVIIEGVHLLPSLIQFDDLKNQAYHIPIVLSLTDEAAHHTRFDFRQHETQTRSADRYQSYFSKIRDVHDYFVEQAQGEDIDIVENDDFDQASNELVQIVLANLQKQLGSQVLHDLKRKEVSIHD